jgi:hypothetical protein
MIEIESNSLQPDNNGRGDDRLPKSVFETDEFGTTSFFRDPSSTPPASVPVQLQRLNISRKPIESLSEITGEIPKEHRQCERMACRYPATISLVFPQDTFTPFIDDTHVLNLTIRGAMARVRFPNYVIDKALREPHYCRIQFGMETLPSRILGKLLWHEPCLEEPSHRTIGIIFDQMSDHDLIKLGAVINVALPNSSTTPSTPTIDCSR